MAVEDPNPNPQPPVTTDEPQWAINLRRTIEELPGKVRASVTDDDKRGIAESVHGLFEQSGAFERPTAEDKEQQQTEPNVEHTEQEPPPKKASGLARFAQWFAGES